MFLTIIISNKLYIILRGFLLLQCSIIGISRRKWTYWYNVIMWRFGHNTKYSFFLLFTRLTKIWIMTHGQIFIADGITLKYIYGTLGAYITCMLICLNIKLSIKWKCLYVWNMMRNNMTNKDHCMMSLTKQTIS